MKKLLLLLIVGGVGFVLCALMGYINVPGLTPPPSSGPSVEKLEPPKDKPAEKPAVAAPRGKEKPAATPEVKKIEPTPEAKKSLFPPIQPADFERAKSLYARADFAGVGRALEGCERAEIEDGPSTQAARTLTRKARLLDALTQRFVRNKLVASSAKLERISLNTGGQMVGVVTDLGNDRLEILLLGNVKTEVKQDDVNERVPVKKDALMDKLHDRLRQKEKSIKADDAFGNMRLGHFCWQYGMDQEAVPYLDKAVESDDFPVLAKVFAGSAADKLVDGWYVLTGKARPGPAPVANTSTPKPSVTPPPPVAAGRPDLSKARAKYDQGVEKYRDSFGDSNQARANLKAAHELFKQARDFLGDGEDAATDDLRMQISRLIYDCSKRSAID